MARIDFDGKRNKYAVYTGPVSDTKLLNPLDNITSMKWHSDLEYIGITETRVISIDLDTRTWPTSDRRVLFAHGKTFTPMITGHALINGVKVPLQGDFLVSMQTAPAGYNVFADATNVVIEFDPVYIFSGMRTTPATLTIHVCNVGISAAGTIVRPTKATKAEISTTRLKAGYFDTDNRHMAASATGDVVFYFKHSLDIGLGADALFVKVGFGQNVLGHTVWAWAAKPNVVAPQPPLVRTKVA